MSTQPVITEPQIPHRFTSEEAAAASRKGVEAKALKRKASQDTQGLIRQVLVDTLLKGKPADKLRAALELNRDMGVMRSEQRDHTDSQLDKGIELLSSTQPAATDYLSSESVARIRAIGADSTVLNSSPGQATDHPSSQEVPPVSGRVTLSPKFFSSPNQPNQSIDSRLDQLDARLNQLANAVEKLLERTT